MADTLFGPGARHLARAPSAALADSGGQVLLPVSEAIDNTGIVPLKPAQPLRLYHLMLDRHAIVYANGLPVETYHPGLETLETMGPNMRALFMTLFPHLSGPHRFGRTVCARMSGTTLLGLNAA
jgi:hypothetical protein